MSTKSEPPKPESESEVKSEKLANPINPTPESGLDFSDDPVDNPSAYPTQPETPGADPAHTAEGVAKMKGREPYTRIEEESAASVAKEGTIGGEAKPKK